MHAKLIVITFVIYLQAGVFGQRQWVNPATTAQEMRNPYTWYRPYYQAAAEAYSNYYQNAREITSQLYQQAFVTGAWGRPPNGNGGGGNSGGGGGGTGGGGSGSGGGGGVPVNPNDPNWG